MTTVQIINATLQLWGVLISILIGICLYYVGRFRKFSGKIYLIMLIFNTCSMLFDVAMLFLQGRPGQLIAVLLWISTMVSFSCNILLIPTFIHYLTVYLQDRKANVSYIPLRLVSAASVVMLLALVINLFYPFLYDIGPDNIYHRGKFHGLACICGIAGILNAVYLVIKHRKNLSSWERVAITIYVMLPLIAIPLQERFRGLTFTTIGNTLSLTLIYLCLQIHQAQQIAEHENALIQSRYATAFSQVQPHFMFNALNSIQYLCKTDTQSASHAISCFAKYLRFNMDSLTCTSPIPLRDDLMHLENYLSIQRIRFPDISYQFNLKTTDFGVPPLTLQPLVENAIHHGVRQLSEGGTVIISTWENRDFFHLEVKDNGGGFPENQTEYEQADLGITNTRTRIELMCNGQMQIENCRGQGVTVHVLIPKEKK